MHAPLLRPATLLCGVSHMLAQLAITLEHQYCYRRNCAHARQSTSQQTCVSLYQMRLLLLVIDCDMLNHLVVVTGMTEKGMSVMMRMMTGEISRNERAAAVVVAEMQSDHAAERLPVLMCFQLTC